MRSERALCERITFDLLFRWFLDMTPDEACFDHSDFTNFRARLDRRDVTKKFSDKIVQMAFGHGLISEEHFSIDGSLLQSHASLKSLKHIEEIARAAADRTRNDERKDSDQGKSGGGLSASTPAVTPRSDSNAWVDFRSQRRGNATHRSVVDPEARLYTKTDGVAYLQHSMHVLMENRNGIGADICVGEADGYAERACGLKMLDRVKRKLNLAPTTLGADKGYDTEDFLPALEERGIEPHLACKSQDEIKVPCEEDEGKMARWRNQHRQREKYCHVSQKKRKLNEEIFGWLKQFGGLRRARVVGR